MKNKADFVSLDEHIGRYRLQVNMQYIRTKLHVKHVVDVIINKINKVKFKL